MRKSIVITTLVLLLLLITATSWFRNNEAIQDTPKYSQQEMVEAITHFNNTEEYEKALLLAKEYVVLYPDDLDGWNHRGYAYLKLGNCDEALSDFYHASVNGNKFADTLISSVSNSDECKE